MTTTPDHEGAAVTTPDPVGERSSALSAGSLGLRESGLPEVGAEGAPDLPGSATEGGVVLVGQADGDDVASWVVAGGTAGSGTHGTHLTDYRKSLSPDTLPTTVSPMTTTCTSTSGPIGDAGSLDGTRLTCELTAGHDGWHRRRRFAWSRACDAPGRFLYFVFVDGHQFTVNGHSHRSDAVIEAREAQREFTSPSVQICRFDVRGGVWFERPMMSSG